MKYGSVCAGIEAASVAWHGLGWEPVFFSEIDPFARAVLKARWPAVPLHGDFTTIRGGEYGAIDLLVGGTPCQDFSVAGLRAGISGERGELTLEFVRLARRLLPRWLVWENVPGIMSTDGGRAFGAFLRLLGECGYGFAYRICDAQYFGVPQRRRRVFVVGCLGSWQRAAAVLFEQSSLWGNPAPRRATGEGTPARAAEGIDGGRNGIAPPLDARSTAGGGGWGTDFLADGGMVARALLGRKDWDRGDAETLITGTVADPVTHNEGRTYTHEGRNNFRMHNVVGHALAAGGRGGSSQREDSADFVVIGAVSAKWSKGTGGPLGDEAYNLITTHALTADGFDATEDGTGRGTPLVTIQNATRGKAQNGLGVGSEAMYTLDQASHHAIAYDITGTPATTGGRETAIHTALRARAPGRSQHDTTTVIAFDPTQITHPENRSLCAPDAPAGSLANHAHPPAVAFESRFARNGRGAPEDLVPPLKARSGDTGKGDSAPLVAGMSVRRLTPRECERLQGFPDDYTLITYRGRQAADGPRYRALGNSMAVPCMRWLGKRIALVEDL